MEFTLSFEGSSADRHLLDYYDAAIAFAGFQRTLALTAHLVLNGEIITQAPSLKGAQILSYPVEAGSWRSVAVIAGTLLLSGGVASKDSALGYLFTSALDYVISESLGFHIDYDKSLGVQIDELKTTTDAIPKELDSGKFEALIEKTENSIKDMHRPIVNSKTANVAIIGESSKGNIQRTIGPKLVQETFDYINITRVSEGEAKFVGRVSSYNSNTFKGRIYIEEEGRPVPFTLSDMVRDPRSIAKIVRSLSANAIDRFDSTAEVTFSALTYESKNGRLKSYLITRFH